ncbi:MAG: acetyl-CoA carboxylase biotin carboxyl carrier protein [Pirellulales bacterium]|nr:acetyl-CoA carboxylase biotin carboxyl carrier protein [Pirellulales bacterium]
MASPPPASGDTFDLRKIRRLVELMNEHDLSEIDLRQGEVRVRLRKNHGLLVPAGGVSFAPPVAATPAAASPSSAPPAAPAAAADEQLAVVKSPMVGTFYTSSSPDSPAYVKVGDHIGPESTVCIIEAMKVFNEIPAGVSGRIAAVLVENGEPVEYGQPLFKVDTRR